MKNLEAKIDTDIDEATVSIKTEDGTELDSRDLATMLVAVASKVCDDFDMNLQDVVDEFFGEQHIEEIREGMH